MLKIFKNAHFLFWSCKNKQKKGNVGKAKKENAVVVNTWKTGYRTLILCETIKYINIEKKV